MGKREKLAFISIGTILGYFVGRVVNLVVISLSFILGTALGLYMPDILAIINKIGQGG